MREHPTKRHQQRPRLPSGDMGTQVGSRSLLGCSWGHLQNARCPQSTGAGAVWTKAQRDVMLQGVPPEHDWTAAETDVWDYYNKQRQCNLKTAYYFSPSISKVHKLHQKQSSLGSTDFSLGSTDFSLNNSWVLGCIAFKALFGFENFTQPGNHVYYIFCFQCQ